MMRLGSLKLCFVVGLMGFYTVEVVTYETLIKAVYETYGCTGIIIGSTNSYQTFDVLTTWYRYSKNMANLGIMTALVNFKQLEKRLSFYTKKASRPLVVILLGNMTGVESFRRIASRSDMGYPVWLFVFTAEKTPNACDFCRQPDDNPFYLSMRSEVLVSCCNSTYIEEWWSKTGENTDTQKLAVWDGRKLFWMVDRALYNRRKSLEKRGLRIVIAKRSTYIRKNRNSFDGFLGEMLSELIKSMNFTIAKVVEEDRYGSWNTTEGYWTGVIGTLLRGEADIAISEFVMTNRRLDVVDYTLPIVVGECRLYIQKPTAQVQWDAYFKAFKIEVWTVIIILIITVPILLTLISYCLSKKRFQLYPMLLEHYLSVWGVYCQQGIAEFPTETSLRIAYTTMILSAVVLTAFYSGSLISCLTAHQVHLPFHSMEEFANDGRYRLTMGDDTPEFEMFRDSKEPIMKKMRALMLPRESLPTSLLDGFRQICNDSKLALYTNEAIKKSLNNHIPCELVSVKTGRIDTIAMILPQRSQYLGMINHYIQQFEDIGLLRRLKHKYFLTYQRNNLEISAARVTGVIPIICVLIGGFIGGIFILVLERMVYSYRTRARRVMEGMIFDKWTANVKQCQRRMNP